MVAGSALARLPIPSYPDDGSGGWVDYSGPFDPDFCLEDLSRSALLTALGGFTLSRVPWGEAHQKVLAERFGHIINIGVMGEDLPEPVNEVTLDPELSDAHGIPAPLVRYRHQRQNGRA